MSVEVLTFDEVNEVSGADIIGDTLQGAQLGVLNGGTGYIAGSPKPLLATALAADVGLLLTELYEYYLSTNPTSLGPSDLPFSGASPIGF